MGAPRQDLTDLVERRLLDVARRVIRFRDDWSV